MNNEKPPDGLLLLAIFDPNSPLGEWGSGLFIDPNKALFMYRTLLVPVKHLLRVEGTGT